jgi:biotin carboxyl carrier protein
MKYVSTINEREYLIEILDDQHIILDGTVYEVDFESVSDQPVFSLIVNGKSYEAYANPGEDGWQVVLRGSLFVIKVEDEREKRLRAALGSRLVEQGEFYLRSPMPGLVVSIPVKEGQTVAKGDVLVILESMKMQNELKSPRAGTVVRVRVKVGDSVEQKATLLSVI